MSLVINLYYLRTATTGIVDEPVRDTLYSVGLYLHWSIGGSHLTSRDTVPSYRVDEFVDSNVK